MTFCLEHQTIQKVHRKKQCNIKKANISMNNSLNNESISSSISENNLQMNHKQKYCKTTMKDFLNNGDI